jgi:hypothetical protein
MKTIKKITVILFLACITMAFTTKTGNDSKTTPTQKTYYFFGDAWGNNDVNGSQENGSDGVAYITNIISITVSSDHYTALNYASSRVKIQFGEAFEARYGREKYFAYYSMGHAGMKSYDSYSKAQANRRRAISDYKSDDVLVRYMNDFEYYED